jgi:hypothetical protein
LMARSISTIESISRRGRIYENFSHSDRGRS